jgi:RNA polymerase primary sigma factor
VLLVRRIARTPISLEKPMGDDGGSEFGQYLEDEHTTLPDDAAASSIRVEALGECMKTLSERERRVLELRYGLNGELPHTLDEIGRELEVTRQRVQQIEIRGLRALRKLAASQSLRDVA